MADPDIEAFKEWLYFGQTEVDIDDLNKPSIELAESAGKAALEHAIAQIKDSRRCVVTLMEA